MGRAGKLDFSIDRVRAVDGEWVPLRYTVNKQSGSSHAVSTGVMTAGAAILFWPAAPAFLLIKGKDVTLNKGMVFDTFTDQDHALASLQPPSNASNGMRLAAAPAVFGPTAASAAPSASVTITSDTSGADIEVDGAFIGNTPTTIPLAAGLHQVSVHSATGSLWQRNLQLTAGSTVTLNAQMRQAQQVLHSSR